MRVLVLGGNGFIGSNIVNSLNKMGAEVFVGGRNLANKSSVITVRMENMGKVDNWIPLLNDFDTVINTVGILRERKGESYNDIHDKAPASLAIACARLDIRLIHISAIGLSAEAKSGFIRSKYLGEQAIVKSGANAVIVRASLLDGQGGYGAKWFRRVAGWPIQFVMKSEGLIAPLQVIDLADAVANLVVNKIKTPNIIELGGVETMSIPDYLQLLRLRMGKGRAIQIGVLKSLVRFASHIFDLFALTPYHLVTLN
ncbi:MAG: hypothetical protein CTY37_06760 [Methylotenera sp.]|nr:MAG: hypothetical protein CTY37_06760 [Methylotenera sp.]PPD17492.1 MAG: hypothetical protein CTY27_03750 [Methylotenera sp.]